MKKYSKFDKALTELGQVLIGCWWFGVLYGISYEDWVAFKLGMAIFGIVLVISVYIIIKYKTWRRK